MQHITCGFIGLGLIGGSIAKALKQYLPDVTILAYDIHSETLIAAQKEAIVDLPLTTLDSNLSACDFLFLCAPVSYNDENLLKIKDFLKEDCILTDVGSVKTGIHQCIEDLHLESYFIGGHPMAGSERIGYLNAKPGLLENAYYILTPTQQTSPDKLKRYQELVSSIHAIPLILSYEEHDYVTAAVSHLPHVIASSLVNLVQTSDEKKGIMKMIAAGGFKDITRIASSSPAMWQQICMTNTENIVQLLDRYIHSLQQFRLQLTAKETDGLYQFFDAARTYRDSFIEASSGPIKKSYTIHVDIPDKTGALANVASLLANNNISIKNIGIVHNREYEEGVLRVEFYEEKAPSQAREILALQGYTLYSKV